jgi:hypothetical protein
MTTRASRTTMNRLAVPAAGSASPPLLAFVAALALALNAAAAETGSATASGANPLQPQELASDERSPDEIYEWPGGYAQRFDGVGHGGTVDGTPHTLVIGEKQIRCALVRPGSLQALAPSGGPGSVWIRVHQGSTGALADAMATATPLSEVDLVASSGGGRLVVRLSDARITRTGSDAGPNSRGKDSADSPVYLLRYRRVQRIGGDPDKPVIQGRVPNPRVGHDRTETVGSNLSTSVGAGREPAAGRVPALWLLTRTARGRMPEPPRFEILSPEFPGSNGPGEAVLEGDQCLVFFLGGVPRSPEIELRSAAGGETVVLHGVRASCERSGDGEPRRSRVSWDRSSSTADRGGSGSGGRHHVGSTRLQGSGQGSSPSTTGPPVLTPVTDNSSNTLMVAGDVSVSGLVSFGIPRDAGRGRVVWTRLQRVRGFPNRLARGESQGAGKVTLEVGEEAARSADGDYVLTQLEHAASLGRPIPEIRLRTAGGDTVVLQQVGVLGIERGATTVILLEYIRVM